MKKLNLTLKIIVITLLVACASFFVGFYIVKGSEETKLLIANIWFWMNNPLPIVGISLITICGMMWSLFSNSSLGKRMITKVEAKVEETKAQYTEGKLLLENKINEIEEYSKKLETELKKYEELFGKLCSGLNNKTAKEIAGELTNEERKDC